MEVEKVEKIRNANVLEAQNGEKGSPAAEACREVWKWKIRDADVLEAKNGKKDILAAEVCREVWKKRDANVLEV